MTATVHTIYAGEGAQDVEVYPVDALGREARATGATVQIVDLSLPESDATRVVLASGEADIDATNTVITAAAGPREADARKVVVTATSGGGWAITVGRKYLLSNSGRTEVIEVDRVEGLDVYATAPLLYDFPATTSALLGLRVSAEFPAEVADDSAQLVDEDEDEVRSLFGVDWVFAGVTGPLVVRTLARIERRGKLPRATRADLLDIDPQLQQAQHARGSLERAIRQADREIDALLMHAGVRLADQTHGAVAAMAVCYLAVALVYESLGDEHEARAVRARERADWWTAKMLDGSKPDDAHETSRATDSVRPRRRRLGALSG